jgi:threonine dehydratase
VHSSDVNLQAVYQARQRTAGLAMRTPLLRSPWLSDVAGATVHLKAESLQRTGSFKIRGAANRMLGLSAAQRSRGVITVSTGNHGRAVAHVARELGIHAVVCMSTRVPANKAEAIERLGAEILLHGSSYDDAERYALRLQEARGLAMIDPFDDPWVIAGQGTVGLELLEDLPDLDTVVVPLSGGGLISGIGIVLKAANPRIRVIGVSMDRAPVMYHSLQAGHPVEMEELDTLADALAGNIGVQNRYTFRLVKHTVDNVVLVSEAEIAEAMAFALTHHHLVVEGGGAVGIAALIAGRAPELGREVAVIVSGSNVGRQQLAAIVAQNH